MDGVILVSIISTSELLQLVDQNRISSFEDYVSASNLEQKDL